MTDEGEGAADDRDGRAPDDGDDPEDVGPAAGVDAATEADEVANVAEKSAQDAGDRSETDVMADRGGGSDSAEAALQTETSTTESDPVPAIRRRGDGDAPANEAEPDAAPGTESEDGVSETETGPDTDSGPAEAGHQASSDGSVGIESGDSPDETAEGGGSTAAQSASETSTDFDGEANDQNPSEEGAYQPGVPEDIRTYDRFQKIDGSTYERANDFLRDRTYITAREWAIARLCADFRTETGVEMTKIGENLPELVPFMTDTYSPQAVNQARAAFEEKVRKAGATFLYGAMSDFFTAEELDDVMYEATEVAKFLLEVEGVDLTVEEELEAEDEISEVMREVREHSAALRHDEVVCPECGHHVEAEDA